MLEPDLAVSPIEQINKKSGKKTIGRAFRNSLKIYTEMKLAAVLPPQTKLLFPVLFDNADDFLNRMDADLRGSLEGVVFFGGLEDMSLGA